MSMPWLIPQLLVSWKLVGINDQDTQINTTEKDKKKNLLIILTRQLWPLVTI